MFIPRAVTRLIEYFEKLPGIGPKTAQRLTFYLLPFPKEELEGFARALLSLKMNTKLCSICKNVSDKETCATCDSSQRDNRLIAVVASPLDAFALERAGFKGVYHVLHGIIDPLNNIGPEDIYINDLIKRLKPPFPIEIVLATNTSMEGESTALYISKLIKENDFDEDQVKITRIARGLPVGGDIEYADDITLSRALEGRDAF